REAAHFAARVVQALQFFVEGLYGVLGNHLNSSSAARRSAQPKRPVMYPWVCSFLGLVNIASVGPYSISSPRYMKAVKSEARAACCMLWLTMTMQYSDFNSSINSSMREVEIGSSAEQGSPSRITLGFTARPRAMHRRCC